MRESLTIQNCVQQSCSTGCSNWTIIAKFGFWLQNISKVGYKKEELEQIKNKKVMHVFILSVSEMLIARVLPG